MLATEYDEKKVSELFFRDGKAEGIAEGKAEGQESMGKLVNILLDDNRIDDIRRVSVDVAYRNELLKQYGLI